MDSSNLPPVDPRLKEHMAELTKWFRDRNLGGFVVLCTGTHAEYKYMFDTSDWSVITFEGPGHMRFKATKASIPNKEERDRKVHHTTDMLGSVQDLSGRAFVNCEQLLGMLKQHMVIETDPVHTPHKEQ